MDTLGDALPREIERVQEIIKEYESLPHGAGLMAATMMKNDIKIANKAIMEGDIVQMISSYKDLKEWRL